MAKRRHLELIEIPTEQLSYVPGPHADRVAMLGRCSGAWRGAVAALSRPTATALPTALVLRVPSTAGAGEAMFRRLIEVPGCRLRAVLRDWWQHAEHGDGHLRLDVPRPIGDAWSLSGVFRRRRISRPVPVELLLSPYKGRWTLLELMPRRMTRPNRVYFRAGHCSLDWFEAAIRARDVLAEARHDGASRQIRVARSTALHLVSTRGSCPRHQPGHARAMAERRPEDQRVEHLEQRLREDLVDDQGRPAGAADAARVRTERDVLHLPTQQGRAAPDHG